MSTPARKKTAGDKSAGNKTVLDKTAEDTTAANAPAASTAADHITAELSLYPLSGDALETIVAFIHDVTSDARVEVVVNQLSTQLRGALPDVLDVIGAAMRRSFGDGKKQVLVAKFLNVDVPIGEPPDLSALDRAPRA
jgi:uncharacterized protein YqgV (UPF0045/DUF77 family)